MNQRILSVVLTLVLVLGVFGASPLSASATTGGPPVHLFNISGGDIIVETDLGHAGRLQVTYGGGVVEDNIDPGDTIQITGTSDVQVADDPSCHVIVDGVTANITIEDLHIEVPNYTTPADNQPPFALKSGADVTLTVTGNNNILKSHSTSDNNAAKNAALDVSTGNSINIKGTGVLTATSGNMSAAIGGSNAIAAGSITIGGTVQILATTGGRSCGIGSGMNSTSTGMSIIIEDNAQVTAIGSEGAAIGIGNLSSGTVSITIKDSAQVNASGGSGDGAGIGGGYTNNTNGANDSQTIVVNIQGNANVTAIGGTGGGAGIGTGYNWAGSGNKPHTLTVNIDGTATVEATATGTGYNNNSPGIGLAGENGSGGTATIDITSPNVTATASTVAGKGYAPAIGASDPGVTPAITYPVVITGGGSGATASGSYSATAPLNINAGTRNGYTFDGWTTTSAHVVFDNAASATTFFSIPVDEVTISGPSTAVVGWDA
ncbi:MAG: hypothetical protein LBN12_07070, partial [Clostridiales Family XIII bacterium]|nr:hypothetical protein [Clostridiales Family XIII bacterium]